MTKLNDTSTTVAELKTRVLAFARERDWEQFHAPKNLSMALAAAIEAKMAANAKKYPVEKAKGRSAKYTEL